MVRWVQEEGLGLDVCSAGELELAVTAGFPPERIVLHGSAKSPHDLEAALRLGVGRIVIDSPSEIVRIAAAVGPSGRQKVMLRVVPGGSAGGHDKIRTGTEEQKFGLSLTDGGAQHAVTRILGRPELELTGLHCHIGSQITEVKPYPVALRRMIGLMARIRDTHGLVLPELDLGGVHGIAYRPGEPALDLTALARRMRTELLDGCAAAGLPVPRLAVEPGRAVVGPAGVALYRVLAVKHTGEKVFVAVDGGMSDNPRPEPGHRRLNVSAPRGRGRARASCRSRRPGDQQGGRVRPAPYQSEKTGEIFLLPVVVSAMLSVMVAPSAPSGVAVSMYELPLLAGHSSSSAQAMNDAGDVVGLSLDENEDGYLVRWGADGSLTRLQAVSGGSGGQAVKVVGDGTVAGFTATPDGVRHAARWEASGALTRLEEPPGYVDGEAQDINDSHVAVGHLSTAARTRPVRWNPDGRATLLRLPPKAEGGVATGINERGEIAGHVFVPGEKTRAVRWDTAGRVHDLGSLGGSYSEPVAINDRGTVIGRATDAAGEWKAVRAVRGTKFKALPSQGTGARSVSVNNADVVVGNVKDHAVRWDGNDTTELAVLPGTGRVFVKGINDAGTGVGSSDERAVTWDPLGRVTALPLPAGIDTTRPLAINAAGSVAGDVGSSRSWPVRWRAVVWR